MQFVIFVVPLRKEFLGDVATESVQAVWPATLFDELTIKQYLLILIIIDSADPRDICNLSEVIPVLHLNDLLNTPNSELVLELQLLVFVELTKVKSALPQILEEKLTSFSLVEEVEDGLAK